MKIDKELQRYLNHLTYRAEYSAADDVYVAFALEFESVKAHASTPEDAIKEVKVPLQMILSEIRESGEELPEPIATTVFKGKILFRTTPEIHRRLSIEALEAKVSLNQYLSSKVLGSTNVVAEIETPRKRSATANGGRIKRAR